MDRPHTLVVGGGIAGMCAALGLANRGLPVVLLESDAALGGACRSAQIDLPGPGPMALDIGVSDFNRATFRHFAALLGDLQVALDPVCQEASFRTPGGRWLWSSTPAGTAVVPGIDAGFIGELQRFKAKAAGVEDAQVTAAAWLRTNGFSPDFARLVVAPRALGCFPSPGGGLDGVQMRSLSRFWALHGIVGPGPADRVCVRGGMHRYVPLLRERLERLGVRVLSDEPVLRIERAPLVVRTARRRLSGHHLVLAVPPAEALRLLARPSVAERQVLGACRTQPGRVVLHGDQRLMPADRARWAAYNYVVPARSGLLAPTITFYPERLARLTGPLPPRFVTLNPHIEPRNIVAEHVHVHPVFGRDDAAAAALDRLQGAGNTWLCGAWTAEPFLHEQAVTSGLAAAAAIAERLSTCAPVVQLLAAARRSPWSHAQGGPPTYFDLSASA